jgi:hypothetical protein
MIPPSECVRYILIQNGVGMEAGDWVVFVSSFPDAPDHAIVIYDTQGFPDGRVPSGERIEHPGVSVQLRGLAYLPTWNKANEIARLLDAQKNVAILLPSSNNLTVMNITRTGTILPMGVEIADVQQGERARQRYAFSINAVLTIKQQ